MPKLLSSGNWKKGFRRQNTESEKLQQQARNADPEMDPIPVRSNREAVQSEKGSQAIGNSREKHPHIPAEITKAGTTVIKNQRLGR